MSLFEFEKITVKPHTMVARVRVANGAPLRTSEDIEGTERVYGLMPRIADHACVCDAGDTLRSALGDTELAHLLEHVTLEFLATAGVSDISVGRTTDTDINREWDVEVTCPDDALTLGALCSAAWLMEWAYAGGGEPVPSVEVTVKSLKELVNSLDSAPANVPAALRDAAQARDAAAQQPRPAKQELSGEPAAAGEEPPQAKAAPAPQAAPAPVVVEAPTPAVVEEPAPAAVEPAPVAEPEPVVAEPAPVPAAVEPEPAPQAQETVVINAAPAPEPEVAAEVPDASAPADPEPEPAAADDLEDESLLLEAVAVEGDEIEEIDQAGHATLFEADDDPVPSTLAKQVSGDDER